MTDLEKLLSENTPPAPRSDLSERIVTAAKTVKPANDAPKFRPLRALGSVAALAIAVVFVLQPLLQTEPDTAVETQWAEAAETIGFADLYEWVESEPTDVGG